MPWPDVLVLFKNMTLLLGPEGQGEFSGRWFPYDKMLTGFDHSWWLYTHNSDSLSFTHHQLLIHHGKKGIHLCMSERKLKHDDFSAMCKMWYESLPHLHILACTRAVSLFTHSRRVYIYKCTGTWTCANTHQHTSTSFLIAWKNSCVL